jgi:hypothetical protein
MPLLQNTRADQPNPPAIRPAGDQHSVERARHVCHPARQQRQHQEVAARVAPHGHARLMVRRCCHAVLRCTTHHTPAAACWQWCWHSGPCPMLHKQPVSEWHAHDAVGLGCVVMLRYVPSPPCSTDVAAAACVRARRRLEAPEPGTTLKLVVRVNHPEYGDFFYADMVGPVTSC